MGLLLGVSPLPRRLRAPHAAGYLATRAENVTSRGDDASRQEKFRPEKGRAHPEGPLEGSRAEDPRIGVVRHVHEPVIEVVYVSVFSRRCGREKTP